MGDDFTLGVEEEYQIVDARTGELRSRARDVLETDWSEEIEREVQQTMLEIGTRPCADAASLDAELRRLRLQAASAAAAEDLTIAAAGLHPFSKWEEQRYTLGARYERLIERFGRVLRTKHVFGMHIHVAVPRGIDRVCVTNELRPFLPHLVALSASSPFYEGQDTGYASYRTILWGRLPQAGPPPRLESEAELRRLVSALLEAGALADEGALYWSIRPHAEYPTVELRATDPCPRVEDAVAIAALARAMVAAACDGGLPAPASGLSAAAEDELLRSNQWQAVRYGLDATLVAPEREAGREPLRDGVRRLLDAVASTAASLDGDCMLEGIERILARGGGADRMRQAAADRGGDLAALVEWLSAESLLGTGIDRRGEQRG